MAESSGITCRANASTQDDGRESCPPARATRPLPQQFRLTDKVAIVTGAGKGIGAGIAVGLAEAGADVALVARTRTDLDRWPTRSVAWSTSLVLPADMNDLGMLPDLVESVAATLGGLDVVVNNEGVAILPLPRYHRQEP